DAEALPVARLLRTAGGGRATGRARFQRQSPEPSLGRAELAGARAPAFRIHQDEVAAVEKAVGRRERFLVGVTASYRENAAVRVDELHRPLEELRLRHEVDLAAQVDGDEEMVQEREVVGRDDHR